jgi:hypothetical protein
MLSRSTRSKFLAVLLVAFLPVVFSPVWAAPQGGSISGVVLAHESHAPASNVKVHVADSSTGKIYVSEATGEDGSFQVIGLPASAYDLGLEQDGNLFLVHTAVQIAPGQHKNIQVAIGTPGNIAPAQGTSVWSNPLTAALIVAGSAIVVGLVVEELVTDDAQAPTSPVVSN